MKTPTALTPKLEKRLQAAQALHHIAAKQQYRVLQATYKVRVDGSILVQAQALHPVTSRKVVSADADFSGEVGNVYVHIQDALRVMGTSLRRGDLLNAVDLKESRLSNLLVADASVENAYYAAAHQLPDARRRIHHFWLHMAYCTVQEARNRSRNVDGGLPIVPYVRGKVQDAMGFERLAVMFSREHSTTTILGILQRDAKTPSSQNAALCSQLAHSDQFTAQPDGEEGREAIFNALTDWHNLLGRQKEILGTQQSSTPTISEVVCLGEAVDGAVEAVYKGRPIGDFAGASARCREIMQAAFDGRNFITFSDAPLKQKMARQNGPAQPEFRL